MANFNPYSNYGYLALKKESVAGTAVVPDIYQRIVSESVMPSFGIQAINEIAGERDRNIQSVQGNIEMSGDVTFFVEEKLIGHWLNGIFGEDEVDTATTGIYRHQWTIEDSGKTYSMDIQPADAPWVHRFFGVRIMGMTVNKDDNGIQCTASVMPEKAFILAKLTAGANSGTTLLVDQTSGLTTSDTLLVIDKDDGYTVIEELTISTIVSETELTVSTITQTLDEGDYIVIKRASVTSANYTQCKPFQFQNGTAIYEGDDVDNTVEITKEDFEVVLTNDLEARYGSGLTESARYPFDILTKGFTATGQITRFYDSEMNLARLRGNSQVGIRYLFQGQEAITTNLAQKASSTWGTTNGFKIEASTAGKAGNDINVTIVINSTDTLAASKSGNNITISLANTTASNNTGTLIAAAVDLLSGVDATAEGTGVETFTVAEPTVNLGARGAGTDVVGLDANQKPYLQIDFANAKYEPFFPSNEEDNIVPEEISFVGYKDTKCGAGKQHGWSVRATLVNGTADY